MKVELNEQARERIQRFLPPFKEVIKSFTETNGMIQVITERETKNEAELSRISAISFANDKEILSSLIARERRHLHLTLREKQEDIQLRQKRALAAAIGDGAELLQNVAAAQLFADAEATLKQSLPESVLSDPGLTSRIVSESAARRGVSHFMNSFRVSPSDDPTAIQSVAERLAQILEDIASGRVVTVPGSESLTQEAVPA